MKLLKDKKGASAIEMVIGLMIIIMMIAFLMDIMNVMAKYSTVSQVSTDISRITGIQGGIRNSAPRGWPGGNDNYININELYSLVDRKLSGAGMDNTPWTVRIYNDSGSISGGFGSTGKKGVEINYLENYTVEVELLHRWTVIGNFLPGTIEQKLVSRRPATSEWQYNYNDWIGESP